MRLTLVFAAALLAGCGGGPVKRVSEPAASIQQLAVNADGSWAVQLRLQNYSSVPMRFDRVDLALAVAGQPAGTLATQPALRVGPESADVVNLALAPQPAARIAVADALAAGRGIAYTLDGTLAAGTENRGARDYKVRRESSLSPVPGLPGTLR